MSNPSSRSIFLNWVLVVVKTSKRRGLQAYPLRGTILLAWLEPTGQNQRQETNGLPAHKRPLAPNSELKGVIGLPHDKKGVLVQPGDMVSVKFKVLEISQTETACKLKLEAENTNKDAHVYAVLWLNAGQTEKV